MTYRILPSQEYLRECFDYDPSTGALTWRIRPQSHFKLAGAWKAWNKRTAGKRADYLHISRKTGQRTIRCTLDYRVVFAHRVIWKLMTGEDAAEIDHRDIDSTNNRFKNLRSATRQQNTHNIRTRSRYGKGVYLRVHKHCVSYGAAITVNQKMIHLGSYRTPAEANEAYRLAALKYYGEYARWTDRLAQRKENGLDEAALPSE